jgi:CRP-like cAMP-binding protein
MDGVVVVTDAYTERIVPQDLCANRLLALLADAERSRLAPNLAWVRLDVGTVLQPEDAITEHVFFPASGLIANMLVMPDEEVTAGIVGKEGALFCNEILSHSISHTRATVRSAGKAWRLPMEAWHALMRGTGIGGLFAAYNSLCIYETQQNAACCLLHDVESRLCRWLLHIHDRLEHATIAMTHADLASLAGTRRTTVTLITGSLHTAGIVESRRGRIDVVDRFALEASACECYGAIRARRAAFESRFARDSAVALA